MKSRPLCFLAATVFLFGTALAAAEQPPDIVSIENEPRHRVAFENASVRVVETRIPPGYTTLYHRHERDSVYVLISGTSNLVTQRLGEPEKPLSAKPGDVFFGAHSKTPRIHRFTNLSAEEHVVLDIELIANSPLASTPLAALPGQRVPVLENERVRVSRILLEPGESAAFPTSPASRLLLAVLAGSRLSIAGDSGEMQQIAVVPGWFYARNDCALRTISNSGKDRLELVEIEIR